MHLQNVVRSKLCSRERYPNRSQQDKRDNQNVPLFVTSKGRSGSDGSHPLGLNKGPGPSRVHVRIVRLQILFLNRGPANGARLRFQYG